MHKSSESELLDTTLKFWRDFLKNPDGFFEDTNEIDKPLMRFIKQKESEMKRYISLQSLQIF